MTAVVCPYCRAKIGGDEASLACEGCGTVHHADCYAENGGCTIFGCSKAPADEPKLQVSAPEVQAVGTQTVTAPAPARVAPPPPPGGLSTVNASVAAAVPGNGPETMEQWQQMSNTVVPSIFGGFESTPTPSAEPSLPPTPRSRTTFIVLGALLGAFGAQSFYAGYKKKGVMQLAVTVCTLGFAGPMVWVWSVIDICTINKDNNGVQFEA
jgi:hypothetical protein